MSESSRNSTSRAARRPSKVTRSTPESAPTIPAIVGTVACDTPAAIALTFPDAPTSVQIADANILIAISSNDEIWIDRRLIDPRAVRANIERLHAENPKGSVVIQADKKSTNEMLVTVMDASRAAGVFNVSIAANP